MLHRLLIPLLAALAALSLGAPAASAAPVFPTGLRVGLEPPPGLVVSHRIPGFEDPEHRVVVAIFELPGQAYDNLMQAGFDKQTQGMTNVSKVDFAVAGGSGYLISGQTKVKDHDLYRWFLMAKPKGSDKGSALTSLIRVDVPDTARQVYSDAVVRKMLASIDFRPTPTKELLSLLPFELKDLAGFRVDRVIPGGAILTDGPSDKVSGTKQPYVIISVGRGGPRESELRGKFARDMLRSSPLNDLKVTSADTIRIGRAPAYELRATAQDPSGQAVTVVQWLRFGTSAYMRVIGVAPKSDWDKVFNRFRAVRDGVASR
jgi:hypothetical protein